MGNKVKVSVEVMGTYRLTLDTGDHLDLFFIPFVTPRIFEVNFIILCDFSEI